MHILQCVHEMISVRSPDVFQCLSRQYKSSSADLKDYTQQRVKLHRWMHAKQRMIALLEPVSSEPHVLNKQLEQVGTLFLAPLLRKHFQIDLLCDELDENRSGLDEISASGSRVVDFTSEEATKSRIQEELRASAEQFAEIERQLHERRANLNAALNADRALQDVEKEFDKWHRGAEEKTKKLSLAVPRGEEEVR